MKVGRMLHQRKKIYKAIKNMKANDMQIRPLSSFYANLFASENLGFDEFVEYSRELINNIIKIGTTVPIPDFQMERRKSIGLPPIKFDNEEIKKIAKLTKLE